MYHFTQKTLDCKSTCSLSGHLAHVLDLAVLNFDLLTLEGNVAALLEFALSADIYFA